MLLGICRLTVKGLLLTTEAGMHKLAAWLQDEEMHRLYERFVLSYYSRHHPEFLPKAAFIDWDIPDDEKSVYLPVMKSDITLQSRDRRLIIDTKYYRRTKIIKAMAKGVRPRPALIELAKSIEPSLKETNPE